MQQKKPTRNTKARLDRKRTAQHCQWQIMQTDKDKGTVANGLEQIAEDAEKPLLKAKQVLTQRQTIISPNTAGSTLLHCHLVCIQVLNQTWLQVLSAS